MQRSIIFTDILRKRGNNYIKHIRSGQPPVLTYNYEMILNAKNFERPANYALVRISERRRNDIDARPYRSPPQKQGTSDQTQTADCDY